MSDNYAVPNFPSQDEMDKDARVAELEETLTLAYRLSLQDAWQELRELLAERSVP